MPVRKRCVEFDVKVCLEAKVSLRSFQHMPFQFHDINPLRREHARLSHANNFTVENHLMCGMLDNYLHDFSKLRTDANHTSWTKSTNFRSPYKPFLLLSIMDMVANGSITKNFIEPSFELTETFQGYIALLPLFKQPPPANFITLGIITVSGQGPHHTGHIKTVIGTSARKRLVLSSLTCGSSVKRIMLVFPIFQ